MPLVIGGHLPGKEILFPVATVILGGLITATIAEFLIRPGLFWLMADKSETGGFERIEDEVIATSQSTEELATVH